MFKQVVQAARKEAGYPFDWLVYAMGIDIPQPSSTTLMRYPRNIGQHVAWNDAFQRAQEGGYTYFLRLDDDVQFKTKRWLSKLIQASIDFNDKFIISPVVRGLKNPPQTSEVVKVAGHDVKFLVAAIGGICRLHPTHLIKDFVADVRKPLGSGDATGIATYCREHIIPMVYLQSVTVRHDTAKQEDEDSEYFSQHDLFQSIPYIPTWKAA